MDNTNDAEFSSLKLRIIEGDQTAFHIVFSSLRDRIFNYIFKITKSRESSEEIVMDVFFKLWKGRTMLAEIENMPAFIFRIARNQSVDFLRKASKDKILQELIWDEIQIQSDLKTDQRIIMNELNDNIERVISAMPKQRQSVFRLSREEHMSYDEIARHMELSKSTIKNHMAEALHYLRANLGKNPDLLVLCFWVLEKYL